MSMISTLYNGIAYRAWGGVGILNRLWNMEPHVLSGLETLNIIETHHKSIARFGDGEFNLIFGKNIGFQNADAKLESELLEILLEHDSDNSLLISIPNVFDDMAAYRKDSRKFWKAYLGKNRSRITNLLDKEYTYGDTNVTRFYTGFFDEDYHKKIVERFKKLWKNRNLIFVEGEKTRMGVGNDFFDSAKSISRILCPATNAFTRKEKIIDAVISCNIQDDDLIILALGPTATVIASDLSRMGFWALDLGHLDLQYEHYLMQASGRIKIEGKYTNEAVGGSIVSDDILDERYKNEIRTIIS